MRADRATNVLHALYVDDMARLGVSRALAEQVMRSAPAAGQRSNEPDPETWGLSDDAIAEQEALFEFLGQPG